MSTATHDPGGGRRVVITGGAGFLGSHLCERFLDKGDSVIAVDNLVSGAIGNIEHLFGRAGFTYVQQDVSTFLWVPGHGEGRQGAKPLAQRRLAE